MTKQLDIKSLFIIFGIPLSSILLLILLTTSRLFEANQQLLSTAITADLIFTIPFVYFLLIRKKKIPKLTIISFGILGMMISYMIIPKENQLLLSIIKTWVFPFVELGIAFFVISKVRSTLKKFKKNQHISPDFFTVLQQTCREILPKKIATLLAMEIAVFYFGFMFWKKQVLHSTEFTYHKNSGTIGLLAGLILIITIETYVLHILLIRWSTVAAWIITGLSIYSGIQIFGFLKSIYNRPILIQDGKLYLRYGIMSETSIDINNIVSVTISSASIEFNDKIRKLSPFGELESHNVLITVHKENALFGLYGMKKSFKTLALYIDDKERFKTEIEGQLPQKQ
ncbi:hypothetical protein [Aquimarina sp. RZ0]|uniref:hypothetical protein n=1 Tax=Aquimarina sp. RZ0 TaxID=2607730 RepID=UPI0011F3D574|nr:hypothetical protein [Aquimarina sp. RZ0]KAA1245259.1 hypothetical protein F0000_12805 [Aquimarina sp. RZ0]